jgi:hypothetical protein
MLALVFDLHEVYINNEATDLDDVPDDMVGGEGLDERDGVVGLEVGDLLVYFSHNH